MWRNAWGKLLGAFFGFILAGPLGALVGIFVGNFFDKGLRVSDNFCGPAPRGAAKKVFNHVTFAVMGHIAKSDGRVSEREIDVARNIMAQIHLSELEKNEAIHSFSQGKSPSFQLGLTLTELRFACRQHPSLIKKFVEIQYNAVVSASSKIDYHKQQLLNTVFEQLGFIPMFRTTHSHRNNYSQYSQYSGYSAYSSGKDELTLAYETLGVTKESNIAEIKKAYRKKMSLHHPDKLMAKGLSEKEIKQATEKAQKIQAAYEKLRQSKAF